MEIIDKLIPWIPFFGSIVVVVLGWLFGRRKQNSDIEKQSSDIVNQTTDSVLKLLAPLNERIDGQLCRIKSLEATVTAQEDELELLRPLPEIVKEMARGIRILIAQLKENGYTPNWTPSELEPVITKLETELKKKKKVVKTEEELK